MKYCIRLTNEKGREVKLAANEYINIVVLGDNKRISLLALRDSRVFDETETDITTFTARIIELEGLIDTAMDDSIPAITTDAQGKCICACGNEHETN